MLKNTSFTGYDNGSSFWSHNGYVNILFKGNGDQEHFDTFYIIYSIYLQKYNTQLTFCSAVFKKNSHTSLSTCREYEKTIVMLQLPKKLNQSDKVLV
jgi:hypothetical protein